MRTVVRYVLGWTLALPAAGLAQPALPVAGSDGRWIVQGEGRQGDGRLAPFAGREAVWLRNNTHALRAGTDFTDGTIEFDVAPMEACDFIGFVFHRQSLQVHENLYVRPRESGRFMALQYAPRTNGSSTWQLYPEFNRPASWPRNTWTHVRQGGRSDRSRHSGRRQPALRHPGHTILHGVPARSCSRPWPSCNSTRLAGSRSTTRWRRTSHHWLQIGTPRW